MRSRLLCTSGLFGILVAAGLSGGAAAEPPTSAPTDGSSTDRCQQATRLLEAGNPEPAIRMLRELVAAAPEDSEFRLRLAEVLVAADRADEADHLLAEAAEAGRAGASLWFAWIDLALDQGRWATALRRVGRARDEIGESAGLHARAARAYFERGRLLGKAEVRDVPDRRTGQFCGPWLLVESRGPGRFLCCPADSAVYQVRAALDAGSEAGSLHVLHARIWQKLGKPDVGLTLLESYGPVLSAEATPAMLQAGMDLSLEAGDPVRFLRYGRRYAGLDADARDDRLSTIYARLAEHYARQGEPTLHREFCRRAWELRRDQVDLALRLAEAEWATERRAEAERLYRRVLRLAPEHPQRREIRARLEACGGAAAGP